MTYKFLLKKKLHLIHFPNFHPALPLPVSNSIRINNSKPGCYYIPAQEQLISILGFYTASLLWFLNVFCTKSTTSTESSEDMRESPTDLPFLGKAVSAWNVFFFFFFFPRIGRNMEETGRQKFLLSKASNIDKTRFPWVWSNIAPCQLLERRFLITLCKIILPCSVFLFQSSLKKTL